MIYLEITIFICTIKQYVMNTSEKPLSCIKSHSCCPSQDLNDPHSETMNRRKFIKVAGGSTLSVAALSGLSWSTIASSPLEEQFGIARKTLVVKPIESNHAARVTIIPAHKKRRGLLKTFRHSTFLQLFSPAFEPHL